MKVVFYSYLFISVCTVVMLILYTIDIAWVIKHKYPGLYAPMKADKYSAAGNLLSWFRVLLASVCPLFNIALLITLVFCKSEITNESITRLKEEYLGHTECENRAAV